MPVIVNPPLSRRLGGKEFVLSTLLFTSVDGAQVPSAVLRGACGPSRLTFGRYALPHSSADTDREFLAVLTDGEAAVLEHGSSSNTALVMMYGFDASPSILQEVPGDATVVVPGGTGS